MDWKYWLLVAISVVGLFLSWLQYRLMKTLTPERQKPSWFIQYWPMALMVFLLIGTWILLIYDPNPKKDNVFQGLGFIAKGCQSDVKGERLMKFQEEFAVAMACGVTDSAIDKYEDTRISVSQAFTIRPGSIEMVALYSKDMAMAINKKFEVGEGIRTISLTVWIEVFLVPKSLDMSKIRKLSDVLTYKGKLPSVDRSLD